MNPLLVLIRCLAGLALTAGAAGCAELFGAPASGEEPRGVPRAAPAARNRCAPFGLEPAPGLPSADELRAALGEPRNGAAIRALNARLGKTDAGTIQRFFVYDHRERGVRLLFSGEPNADLLTRVELFGYAREIRGGGRAYAGALPADLRFTMEKGEVQRRLGPSDPASCEDGAECWYRAHGLFVRFAEGCLLSVGLVAPLAPRTTRFPDRRAWLSSTSDDTKGIRVELTQESGSARDLGRQEIELRLEDGSGAPVTVREEGSAFGDERGALRVTIPSAPSSGDAGHRIFVPLTALALKPGRHTLHGRLSARGWPSSSPGATPSDAVALEVLGRADLELTFEMPMLKRVRLSVSRVEVEPGKYDDSFPDPDLRWVVFQRAGRQGYTSTTRDDTLVATFSEYSGWMTLVAGEPFGVCVEDEDVLGSETIGCFSLKLEDVLAWANTGKTLSAGRVRRLVLARPQIGD